MVSPIRCARCRSRVEIGRYDGPVENVELKNSIAAACQCMVVHLYDATLDGERPESWEFAG